MFLFSILPQSRVAKLMFQVKRNKLTFISVMDLFKLWPHTAANFVVHDGGDGGEVKLVSSSGLKIL